MTTLAFSAIPHPTAVRTSDDKLTVDLADGRTITVPILWYPRLSHGTRGERKTFELGRIGIHWPDLDEDISVEGLLMGKKSGESPRSLQRWLERRKSAKRPRMATK